MYPELGRPISYAGALSMIIALGTIISSLQSDRLTRKLGTSKVTAISVAMTAAALTGNHRSTDGKFMCGNLLNAAGFRGDCKLYYDCIVAGLSIDNSGFDGCYARDMTRKTA